MKQGKIAIEILIFLVVIVLTSAAVLFMVNTGLISVKAENEQVPILNTQFIPMGREGYLAIKEFQFCSFVDENFNCVTEKETFSIGEEVHFRFIVESSTHNGEVMVVENYRIKGPQGNVLLEVDEKNNFHFDLRSNEKKESTYFKDYFTVNPGSELGEYTIDLVIENPLLDKRTTSTKKIMIEG